MKYILLFLMSYFIAAANACAEPHKFDDKYFHVLDIRDHNLLFLSNYKGEVTDSAIYDVLRSGVDSTLDEFERRDTVKANIGKLKAEINKFKQLDIAKNIVLFSTIFVDGYDFNKGAFLVSTLDGVRFSEPNRYSKPISIGDKQPIYTMPTYRWAKNKLESSYYKPKDEAEARRVNKQIRGDAKQFDAIVYGAVVGATGELYYAGNRKVGNKFEPDSNGYSAFSRKEILFQPTKIEVLDQEHKTMFVLQ